MNRFGIDSFPPYNIRLQKDEAFSFNLYLWYCSKGMITSWAISHIISYPLIIIFNNSFVTLADMIVPYLIMATLLRPFLAPKNIKTFCFPIFMTLIKPKESYSSCSLNLTSRFLSDGIHLQMSK